MSQAGHRTQRKERNALNRRTFLVTSAIAGTGLLAGCLDEETSDETETGTESDEEEEDSEGSDGTGEEENGSEPDTDEDPEEEPSEPTEEEPDEEGEEENESEPTEDEVNESEETDAEDDRDEEDGRSVTIQEARWIGGEDEDEEITVTAVVLNDGDVPLTIDLTATARTGAEELDGEEVSETETAEEIQPGDGYDFLLSFSAPGIGDHIESGETDDLVEVEAVAYEPNDDEEPIRTATFARYDRATAGADSLSILSLLQRIPTFF
jgi:hypothetical protein